MKKIHKGFIAKCSSSSHVNEVVLDDYGILSSSISIISLVDRSNSGKFFSFLSAANSQGGTIGWEINFKQGEKIVTYFLAGIMNDDKEIIITGSTLDSSMRKIYNDIMKINNEQTNSIRLLQKQNQQDEARLQEEKSSFDELTKINNEMAVLHRELSKKNAELAWANAKLEGLNKEKDHFLGMAAHDLRNPLSVILQYATQLYGDSDSMVDQSQKEMLHDIKKSSLLMLSVVNDFLDVNKIKSGGLHITRSAVDVVSIIKDSVSAHQKAADTKNISLEFQSSLPALITYADGNKLMQIMNNLISNAIKYSHTGTTTKISLEQNEKQLRIEVADEGQGIAAVELRKLFKPFGTTSVRPTNNEKSIGLGLSIIAKIIEAHKGEYGVESQVGKGSTFWITLPVVETGEAAEEREPKKQAMISLEGKNILIVDDDEMLRRSLAHYIKPTNANVLFAADGVEAIGHVDGNHKIDLILMDLNMPGMDGIEACHKIREHHSSQELPIIIVSGSSDDSTRKELIAAGANAILLKPVKKEVLIEKVGEHLS